MKEMLSADLPEVFSIHHPHQPVNLSTSHFLSASGISTEMFALKNKWISIITLFASPFFNKASPVSRKAFFSSPIDFPFFSEAPRYGCTCSGPGS